MDLNSFYAMIQANTHSKVMRKIFMVGTPVISAFNSAGPLVYSDYSQLYSPQRHRG